MKQSIFLVCIFLLAGAGNQAMAQYKRVDSTLKTGKVGYRLSCSNKDPESNEMDVRPIGFESSAQASRLFIKGRITGAVIDDLNNDGFPDLIIYTRQGIKATFGTVYAIISVGNKSMMPAGLPDVQLDGKYRDGYRGEDEFSLMEGTLMRKFPVYNTGDSTVATGGRRIIQYQLTGNSEKGFKFTVLQSFNLK